MNADRLLALYDRVSEAPNAVARLRRFVLELAVRGMLTKQNPHEEPASELLERIAIEKMRLIRAGEIKAKPLNGQTAAPIPFELPKTWEWTTLGEAFLYDAGIKRAPKELDPSFWLLELEDIEKDTGCLIARVCTNARNSKSTKSEFQEGDILYGKLRPYLNKVVVADRAGYSTTEIVAVRPIVTMNAAYCALALRRPDFVDYVTRCGQGTKMPRLRREDGITALFPLPPVEEQNRIVAKVEELMAVCDRAVKAHLSCKETRVRLTKSSLARLIAPNTDAAMFRSHALFAIDTLSTLTARAIQVKNLRQTILDLAVRGKLVKQNPADEPASELLRRIALEKARQVRVGKIKLRKLTNRARQSSQEFVTPSGWQLTNLGSIALRITDGAHKTPTYVADGIPFVSVKDFSAGQLDLSNTRFIPLSEHRDLYKRCDPRRGDILLGRIGTLGKAVLVNTDVEFSLFVSVGLIRFDHQNTDPNYLQLILNSPFVEQEFDRIKIGGGTHTNKLNLGDLHTVAIPLAPLAEQRRIVAKLDELMTLCDQLESSLLAADNCRIRLLESALRAELPDAA